MGTVCFLVFGILRTFSWSQKFYAPKEFLTDEEQKEKPKPLPRTFWGWLGPLFSSGQDEVIRTAGVDAAMYAHKNSSCCCDPLPNAFFVQIPHACCAL